MSDELLLLDDDGVSGISKVSSSNVSSLISHTPMNFTPKMDIHIQNSLDKSSHIISPNIIRESESYSPYNYNSNNNYNNISNNDFNLLLNKSQIPKIPIIILLFFIFGIILLIFIVISTFYFTIDNNITDVNGIDDIRNIVLPIFVFIFNMISCFIFYITARNLQLKGYSILFRNSSNIAKLNFRFISIYFLIIFASYGFIKNHENDIKLISNNDKKYIYLALFTFGYLWIICCLFRFWYLFSKHNRLSPKPDIFNNIGLNNSPSNQILYNNYTEREVMKQLFNDKKALKKKLQNTFEKLQRSQFELNSLKNNKKCHVSFIDSNDNNESTIMNTIQLKNEIGSLKSSMQAIKTVLHSKKIELKKSQELILNYENIISKLKKDKDNIELKLDNEMDKRHDLKVLYQVKEEEVKIAKNENERLRNKLILLLNIDSDINSNNSNSITPSNIIDPSQFKIDKTK